MNTNSYLAIANNDYQFLQNIKDMDFYNNIAIQCQQIVEKYLKYLVYTFCIEHDEAEKSLKTHNLVKLNMILLESGINLQLNRGELSVLKDYYFDAKYPGDNYIFVSKEDAKESIFFVETVRSAVWAYLGTEGYCCLCGSKLLATGGCSCMER